MLSGPATPGSPFLLNHLPQSSLSAVTTDNKQQDWKGEKGAQNTIRRLLSQPIELNPNNVK